MSKDQSQSAKFKRAKIRHKLFTTGPNHLSGGRLFAKHFDQSIQLNEIDIVSPVWPTAFDGLRIGHVSDFHLGDLMPIERAKRAIEMVQAHRPDIVACTGDVVDLHLDGAEELLSSLATINAPLGTMLVFGNHDELECASTLSSLAIDAGVVLLRDTACQLQHRGQTLRVAGIDWANSTRKCAKKVDLVCDHQIDLLLSHNPKAFKQAAIHNIPLTLSGHTHGGQLAIKNKRSANLAVSHRYSSGLYTRGDSRLIVTVGVGAWFPLRVNCPAEVMMITMRSGSQ